MRADIAAVDLQLRRRALLSYVVGMALYALVIVVLYPQFKGATSLDQLTKNGSAVAALFGATGSLTSPSGWLDANIYENFLPLIMLLITVGYGASCIAGQDEDGTLALAAMLPISRRALVLQKVGALTVQALLPAIATMGCVLIGRQFDLSFPITHLAGLSLGVALLGVDFGLCALAVGSITGSRGTALGVTAALAAASYVVSSLAPVIEWIRPARYASLFYWSVGNQQLANGLSLASVGVLVAVGALLTLAAVAGFRKLDLH
ncbi:MAG TPA: ABC transporter permease subunit [Candidatus Saccharimonadales bacterium]|nr:ABC transporter permease subunit [Candidatus Saccharimonadales bacterium]